MASDWMAFSKSLIGLLILLHLLNLLPSLSSYHDCRLALLPLLKSIDQNPDEEGFVRVPVDLVARYYELEAQHWGRMLQQGGSIPSATSKDSRAMM